MRDLEKYILPIPYSPYDKFEQRKDFESYKNMIMGWVENNKLKLTREQKLQRLDMYFECLHSSQDKYTSINMLLINNIDKVELLPDFSGVSFGISIDERLEQLYVNYATLQFEELIPNYNREQFKELSMYDKVKWLLENSEFLPIRCFYEVIDTYGNNSHKFSHIKNDKTVMKKLEKYLKSRKYTPSDNAYYFIDYNVKTQNCFLIRDTDMSPKKG